MTVCNTKRVSSKELSGRKLRLLWNSKKDSNEGIVRRLCEGGDTVVFPRRNSE